MKKSFIFSMLFTFMWIFNGNAQEFEQGTNLVSLGVGFGSSFGNFTSNSQTPGLSLQYERGIWEVGDEDIISLGGYLGYKSFKYNYGGGSVYKWNYTIVGIRGAYHINSIEVEDLDLYAGAMLSYNFLSYTGAGTYNGTGGFTAFGGARYYFTENIAAMLELGYGVAYINLGATFRF